MDVAAQRFQHAGSFGPIAPIRLREFKDSRYQSDRIQRRAKIVRHKCQILITSSLQFESLLCGKCLNGQSDRLVEHSVQDMKSLALQAQVMALREIVDASAQDVVLCDDFYDVKAVLVSLKTVDGRTAFNEALPESSCQSPTGVPWPTHQGEGERGH